MNEPTLDDFHWLVSEEASRWFAEAAVDESLLKRAARLSAALGTARAHLVLQQVELRRRGRAKFADAERMFFTQRSLEQATDEALATVKQLVDPLQPETLAPYGFLLQYFGRDAEGSGDAADDPRQRLSAPQPPRALDMEGEIAIAQSEPGLPAQRLERRHEVPALIAAAPAQLAIGEAGERIENRVDIGRDGEAQMLEIIAGIHDEREVPAKDARQAQSKLGATDATG